MKKPTDKAIQIRPVAQRGLSLIELMISITIGLLILVSLSSMFINQSKARAELDKSNRMIDNGRYALELLSGSLRLAGFYGAYSPAGTPTALPDPCNTATMVDETLNLDLLLLHVQGYEAANKDSMIASPPCSLSYTSTNNDFKMKAGSDILVVRRANTSTVPQATALNNGTVYLQVSSCQHDPENLLPNTALYFMSTNTAAMKLGQRNITGTNNCYVAGGIKNVTAPYAELRAFIVEVYFIAPNNNANDGIPTLKRRTLSFSGGSPAFVTTPLVEGIEYLQVEYGLDADSNGAPDSYTSCAACTLADWTNVVSVRLNLVARNIDMTRGYSDTKTYSLGVAGTVGPLNDAYKRHAYTQVVRLVNPSGRKELP